MVARVFRARSLQQEDRLPIESFDDAIGRLVLLRNTESVSDDAYDLCVKLVADLFWETDAKVRRKAFLQAKKWGLA